MTIEAQNHILEQRRSFFLSLSLCYFLQPYIIDLTTDKICFPQYSTSEEIAILLLQKTHRVKTTQHNALYHFPRDTSLNSITGERQQIQ